jgi:hypothetical protein
MLMYVKAADEALARPDRQAEAVLYASTRTRLRPPARASTSRRVLRENLRAAAGWPPPSTMRSESVTAPRHLGV